MAVNAPEAFMATSGSLPLALTTNSLPSGTGACARTGTTVSSEATATRRKMQRGMAV